MEVTIIAPILTNHMRYVLTGKFSIEEAATILQQEFNKHLHDNFPRKHDDPGKFTLPCVIGDLRFKGCLCDLGASVTVMPLAVSRRLGLISLNPSRFLVVLGDKSVRKLEGCLENIPIKVGGCWIPTYFLVLDVADDTYDIILGRSFLATTHTAINVPKGKITLRFKKTFMKL